MLIAETQSENIKTIEQQISYIKNCNIAIQEFLKGIIDSTKDNTSETDYSSSAEIKNLPSIQCDYSDIEQGESQMKYNGKTIFRRKNRKNTWYMRYRVNGKQYTVYGKTQKEVIANYNKDKKEKESTNVFEKITLEKWFEEYLKLYKFNKVTETTILKTREDFKHLAKLYKKEITKITPIEIQSTLNNIKYPSARKNAYILINALMEKAFRNNLIKQNIVKLVDRPYYKPKENNALTKLEEKKFIEECSKYTSGDFYLLCLYQGLRKGECRALKVNDIDFELMTLRVDESLHRNTKRTNTKNIQSNRVMPIFNKSMEILKRNIINKSKDDLIFNIGVNKIDTDILKIQKESGIRKITNHSLRHTFITRCQERNIPLFVVQQWVGHEKGSVITTKIYTHLNNETNKKYVDIMNDTLDTHLDTQK